MLVGPALAARLLHSDDEARPRDFEASIISQHLSFKFHYITRDQYETRLILDKSTRPNVVEFQAVLMRPMNYTISLRRGLHHIHRASRLQSSSGVSHRHFSVTSSTRFGLVDAAVAAPLALLDGAHSIGIPWYAAIPLTAITVRSTFVYFLSTRPMRKDAQLRASLIPLNSAMSLIDNANANAAVPRGVASGKRMGAWVTILDNMRRSRKIGQLFGLRLRVWSLAINFTTLLSFVEAIRLKSGTKEGLLRLILGPIENYIKPADPAVPNMSPEELLALRIESARETELQSGSAVADEPYLVHLDKLNVSGPDVTSPYFDPSLQLEGLSWCADLTHSDPTLILPIAFTAIFGLSIILQPRVTSSLAKETSMLQRFRPASFNLAQKIGLCVTVVFAMSSPSMPAAILLYWIPSIATGWAQNRYLDYRYPRPVPIQPCSRPLRWMVRIGWK